MMNVETVENGALFERVAAIGSLGYRLVQVSCTRIADGMELTYSFDKDTELMHLRTVWSPGGTIPSIQPVYGCAFVYENEIAELFGVTIGDMVIDFKGQLYKSAQPSPFGPGITIQEG